MDHVNFLAGDVGSRSAGTPNELRGAEYIRDQLSSYGYQAELQPFSIDGLVNAAASLKTTGASARDMSALAMSGSGEGNAEGRLIMAGLGYPGDFPSDTGGRIALIQRGEIFFAEKVNNAVAAGAAAVIIYNNEPGPFSGEIDPVSIPVVSISLEDGQSLASELGAVSLAVGLDPAGVTSHNVIARPPDGSCRIVVGGHHDSVPAGPGANDNASGTAVAIEMARALAADGEFDDICFVLFGAEEIGLVGSFHYVRELAEEDRAGIEAMLNFDMLAVGDRWPLGGSTELVNVAGEVAEQNGIQYTIESLPEGLGSDHAAFIQAGIPAIIFNCFCDPNYHTAQDLPQFVKQERLGQAGALGMGMVGELLTAGG